MIISMSSELRKQWATSLNFWTSWLVHPQGLHVQLQPTPPCPVTTSPNATSPWFLNNSRDGDSAICLGSLCQYISTLMRQQLAAETCFQGLFQYGIIAVYKGMEVSCSPSQFNSQKISSSALFNEGWGHTDIFSLSGGSSNFFVFQLATSS